MRLISQRAFEFPDPILALSHRCRNMLFCTDHGDYILYIKADSMGEKLLRLGTIAALAWLSASPEEYCDWLSDLD